MTCRTIGKVGIHDSSIVMIATLFLSVIQFLPVIFSLDLTSYSVEHVLQPRDSGIVLGFCMGFFSLIALDLILDSYMRHFELWASRATYLSIFAIYTCFLLSCSDMYNIGSYYYCSTSFTTVVFMGRALSDLVITDQGKQKSWTLFSAMFVLTSISLSLVFSSLALFPRNFVIFQALNVIFRFISLFYFGWTSVRCLNLITNNRISRLFEILRSKEITHEQLILVIIMAILLSTAISISVIPSAIIGFQGVAAINTASTCADLIIRAIGVTLLAVVPSVLLKHKAVSLQYDLEIRRNFVRYVSHEIRTPLNIASLGVKLLQDEFLQQGTNQPEVCEILRDTKSSIDTAIDILGDLLTYEKLDANMMELEQTCCRITAFIRRCLSPFRVQAAAKAVELSILDPNQFEIDASLDNVFVDIDESKMAQVLRNFMSNALKFTPEGGKVSVTVDLVDKVYLSKTTVATGWRPSGITPTQKRKLVRVSIRDTGYGIEPENQHRLWKEMTQFNAKAQQQGGGTGLGLWITKRIVELHDGHVGFHSEGKGKGSEFYFELPIVENPQECIAEADNESESIVCNSRVPEKNLRLKVLIVDDSSLNRKMTSRLLGHLGCETRDAEDGQSAVDEVQGCLELADSIDVILMDSEMPRMNGVQATSIIRGLGYRGLIIGVTGNGQAECIQEFKEAGADHVLIKPLSLAELRNILNNPPVEE